MTETANYQRWYDKDPTVSLAVSILRNAQKHNQEKTSEFIIKKAKAASVRVCKKEIKGLRALFRRWYDHSDKVADSLEYLRAATPEIQKQIALETIDLLCKLEEQRENSILDK